MKRQRTTGEESVKPEAVLPPVPVAPRRRAGDRLLRWLVNLWVLFHFAGVLAAAITAGPTSDLIIAAWKPFRPYLQALYLNNGYNFYAPQPAPSTLLRYEIERGDATKVRGSVLDRSLKPRLFYHRYLLLTEHLVFVSEPFQKYWYQSYARHLCHKFGASRVRFTRVIHYPPTMEMVRAGATLDEPESYEEAFVGDFSCGEF